jgi:tRNA-specific 2-thiouridylase
MVQCIVMFSGGLDSTIAVHLLKQQGLSVTALHFALPFESGLDFDHSAVKKYADGLSVPLRIEEEGEEFLGMVSNPEFGYGKCANPCIDCRIHRLKKAEVIMDEVGASFIATGEVIGQRPKSQRKDSLLLIERTAGLEGLLLRPLSAQLLEPTIPETKGWVDRSKLLAIKGRSRKEQIAYAKKYELKHGAPAGGCVLTEKEVANRFVELKKHEGKISLSDFKLLAYGRHFRINPEPRLIVGRFKGENDIIEKLFEEGDIKIGLAEITGPIGLGRGVFAEDDIQKAASIVARYSRDRGKDSTLVKIEKEGVVRNIKVKPTCDEDCNKLRI